MEIITGYTGANHVTAMDDSVRNTMVARYGEKGVFPIYESMTAYSPTANTVRIYSGYGINQGRLFRIERETYDEVTIETGNPGTKRADIIVARYTQNETTGVERIDLVAIRGESGSDYVDPPYTEGDLMNGALLDDMPLYRVKLDGIAIVAVEQMFKLYPDGGWLGEKVDKVEGKGLSTNDYTNADKNKLSGIAEQATRVSVSQGLNQGTLVGTVNVNGKDTNLYAPPAATDAASTSWVNNNFVKKSGDTMTGALTIDRKDGTASSAGASGITLGNNTASGADKNSRGFVSVFSNSAKRTLIYAANNLQTDNTLYLPTINDATLATTYDLATKVNKSGDTISGNLTIYNSLIANSNSALVLGDKLGGVSASAPYPSRGLLRIYSGGATSTNGYVDIITRTFSSTGGYTQELQAKGGTIALTSDIPSIPGIATTSANGLLRALNNNASYFMNGQGNWAIPPNTNTWRGIQDNLTSTSTTDSLSANQGRLLNAKFTDGSVTKVGTATKGGVNQPVYLNAGTPTVCNSFVPASGGTFSGGVTVSGAVGATALQSKGNIRAGEAQTSGDAIFVGGGSGARGIARLYLNASYHAQIYPGSITANRTLTMPNAGGTIAIQSSSSRRIKENIRDITEEEASRILDVEIVKFDYIGEHCGGLKDQSGVIAEDVIDIIPEAVHVYDNYKEDEPIDEEKNPSPEVDYRKFVPYLIKMVQMQQQQIDELKAEIKALKEG